MTSTVPVWPMPALLQVNNSLRHWWQAQSPSDQCPHYNKLTTVSDTDDKHSPRPANARTTTSQQQSQTLMTSTVPVRPMLALQQVNNSLRHWGQAQSPSGQCPHYNKSTTVSDTDDKHSPRPTNARTTTSQQQSQTLMTSTVPVRPMPTLQQVNNSLRHCLHGATGLLILIDNLISCDVYLQCTTTGPASGIDSCLSLMSCRKLRTQPGSEGTPWSGHALKWKW